MEEAELNHERLEISSMQQKGFKIFISAEKHKLKKIMASQFGKLSRQVDQREVPSPQLAWGSTGHLIETRSVKVFKGENETFRQIFFQRRRTALC